MKRLTATHLALGLALCLPVFARPAFALSPSEVFEQVKDSVLVIKVYDAQGNTLGQGSGVMLPTGGIVTNCHVVKEGIRYQVGKGNQFRPATWTKGDPDKDICLLKAEGIKAKPARLGKATELKVGEAVYAVGSPQGLELSFSDGVVSQLRGETPPLIQTTAAISPGSSGGGLFNAKGLLVGITTFYLKGGQNLNFALPVEWINDLKEREKIIVPAKKKQETGEAFLEKNKKKEGVVTLPSGLQYKVITEGKGKQPKSTDTVVAHYRGTLINGTEFDSSYKRNEPATFPVEGVIKGWQEALPLMKEGAKWQVYIPAELGYGPRGAGAAIGPNEVLIFDIELLSVKSEAEGKENKESK